MGALLNMMKPLVSGRLASVWWDRGRLCLAALLAITAGCSQPPPPPPPPPPAAAAEPAPAVALTDQQTAQAFQPFFMVLYSSAFDPTAVEWSDRQPWLPRYLGEAASLSDDVRDAIRATPYFDDLAARVSPVSSLADRSIRVWEQIWEARLSTLADWRRKQRRDATAALFTALSPGNEYTLTWLARLLEPHERGNLSVSDEGPSFPEPVSPEEAVLSIYQQQAVRDADAGNLHRAHVLLRDVSAILDGSGDQENRDYLSEFRRFFAEVPDAGRYADTAARLNQYMQRQEEQIVLRGEQASVLKQAGMLDAASFMRDSLLTRFDLVTLPLIDAAIARGESYGFRAPTELQDVRRRVVALASDLRPRNADGRDDAFRREALAIQPDAEYRGRFKSFEQLVRSQDTGPGRGAAGSMEKSVRDLQDSKRPFVDWLQEKSLCLDLPEVYLWKVGVNRQVVMLAAPLQTDANLPDAFVDIVRSNADSGSDAGKSLLAWCQTGRCDDARCDGAGNFLLAWFWLEQKRPDLARQALLDGGRTLLQRSRAVRIDQLRVDSRANRDKMLAALRDEINGFRLLSAAATVADAPAGAVSSARDSYVPEVRVLLEGWQQSWLACGFEDEVARRVRGAIDEQTPVVSAPQPAVDRYYFFDYRFEHGFVPDVVVLRATKTGLFSPDGSVPPAKMIEFIDTFRRPRQLSDGARKRFASERANQAPKGG